MYHISPETGRPNKCYAVKKACPIGGKHFESKEQARQAFEKANSAVAKPLKKAKQDVTFADYDSTLPGMGRGVSRVTPTLRVETRDSDKGWVKDFYSNDTLIMSSPYRQDEELLDRIYSSGKIAALQDILQRRENAFEDVAHYMKMDEDELKEERHAWASGTAQRHRRDWANLEAMEDIIELALAVKRRERRQAKGLDS